MFAHMTSKVTSSVIEIRTRKPDEKMLHHCSDAVFTVKYLSDYKGN